MVNQSGIFLLDKNEVIVRVYKRGISSNWQITYDQKFDLETFTKHLNVEAHQIIEIIAQVSLSEETVGTESWHICARNLSEDIIRSVREATGLPAEILTLEREQELLCKGILSEEA